MSTQPFDVCRTSNYFIFMGYFDGFDVLRTSENISNDDTTIVKDIRSLNYDVAKELYLFL